MISLTQDRSCKHFLPHRFAVNDCSVNIQRKFCGSCPSPALSELSHSARPLLRVLSSVTVCFVCCFTRMPAEQEQKNSFLSFPSPQVTLCPGKCHCHNAVWAKTHGELLSFTNSSEKMQRHSSPLKGCLPVAAASVLVARTVLGKLIIKRQVSCFKGAFKILHVLPVKQFLQSPWCLQCPGELRWWVCCL